MQGGGLLLAVLVSCPWTLAAVRPARVNQEATHTVAEQYLFQAANAERSERGIRPLRWDDGMARAAEAHVREMAERASISHQYPGEPELAARDRAVGVRFSVVEENVGEAPTAVRIEDAWMHSPGHRNNLLSPRVNAVGISVLDRDGQLYAVEDFARTVADLSLAEQENEVATLLQEAAPVMLLPASDGARQTCAMETGYAGPRLPWFVMRFTATDLTRLPDVLKTKLATGRYHEAAVGACAPRGGQSFSTFRIAVLLYP